MKVVEVTIVTHKTIPVDMDLVKYEETVKMAYESLLKDPNIKVHVKG